MSTLCAYENYLRDRYVLGQSVHYAAGSNSPKPKSYDREGNEYIWSDEAGDYVRQVGGPGGGRTIRLSEVEKAEVEQPQTEQADTDSGQYGSKKEATSQSNVDYSEFADAYKRYRAEDKKVASLKRKASKIQKAVSSPSSGTTPEEIQSARESLAKIRGEISASEKVKESLSSGLNLFTLKHHVVFIDSGNAFVINPSLELLDGLKQRKRLQDRFKKAQKNAKEAKKAGSKADVDNFTYIADKLEAEIGRVNEQLAQMFPNETVVSVVDEKPKLHPAIKKKEPQRKISFDENASYEELVQKHYPDGKQVDFGDLGYTPSWRKGVITLSDIALAIESNNLTFFDNAFAPTRFDDHDAVVLQDPDGNKRRLTNFELFELIRERLEDNNPEEPYRQEENDVDDALYGYKWVKLPRELRRAVDKRNETRQINREVSEAIVVLNDFSEQIGNIAKYDEIPGDLLTGLVDCYLGIEKTAPHHDEGVGPKKIFLSRVNNFLAGVSLARFLADNEDSPARGAAVRLVEDFLEAALSKTPKRKFNAIYDKAKELGFSLYSVVDVYNSFYTPAEYSAVKPSAPGESQGHSNNKPDRTDETTKKPEEPGAKSDASVLELPGKSDVALKPDITENKNAADFIRRDLEAMPKSETEERSEEVDEVSETKKPVDKPEVSNPSVPEQQSKVVEEPAQEQPAKPRPERWTPLKSKMNDDDRRVVENTRKRLNFGLADFAWRIANAKEKKDWQKAKELTVLAAQRYLEQARRAYRSHGGAEALAAFDETLSGEGLTVGQVRDRVVDKFRQLALMNVADLHKYAGERLDEWEAFSQGAELPATKDKIALNRLLDKPHYAPNAVPYTPPEKGKIYEVPIDSLNLDPSRFQFKLNTNAQGVTDDLEGAEFDPMQAGIIHVWRDPDDGKDYVVNGHHRFNLAKNSGYDGKVNVRYIDADTADDAKAFGAVVNIADSKGTATDVAEFIRTRGSDDIRTPGGKKIATKNKLLADGRVLSKLDETIFRKLKNGSIDEKTARIIAAELPDDKEKQLRLFSDIERLGLDASQAQDRAWAYASIQGEKQQGSLFGDDAPMEYDVESRSKLIGEIRKALGGAKRAAQAGGSSRNNEYWESQKLATNFDRDRAKQLSKSAGQTLDFFKDHIRLTGPMQNIIKEETDEYRKAIKSGKGAEKVVERAIERIKDVAQGGDGSVRRVEGLGLEYEDRLPSAKSERTGQGVEAKEGREKQKPSRTPSENLRSRATGEVLEAGGTDRFSDGGDGRNLASVIAEEAKKSGIPENRVREELNAPRQSKTSTPQEEEKPDWLVALESQEELKPVSKGKYNPHARPYSWKEKFPETEEELRAYGQKHIDGGEVEEFNLGSDGEKITIGEHSGDEPMTLDELRRFAQLRHGRELRKSLGLSEHFSEKELKELQAPSEKRGQGRPSKKTAGATQKVSEPAQLPDSLEEFPKPRIDDELLDKKVLELNTPRRPARQKPQGSGWTTIHVDLPDDDDDDEDLPSNKAPSPSEKIAREAQKSEVPKEQVQERIAEALGAPTDTSKRKNSRRPKKNFDPDSIKNDVEKAVQIRDADRSQLSVKSIDSIMSIAQKVSDEYGVDGLKDFMRRIDVVPIARSVKKLKEELSDFLKDYRLNRYKATVIREM